MTDFIGKPVLTLDRGNISGTGSYEAFGYANRREYPWGSPHNNTNASTTITPPMPPPGPGGFDGPLRVLTSRSKYGSSTVTLAGYNENGLLNGDRAHTWTNWRYSSSNSWTLAWTAGSPSDYGIDVEAYEVQAKQYGTWWAWTPLRFPGHYYDAETELHENWNRYFDPRNNRYLSPEPMLHRVWFPQMELREGFSVAGFAYARANPVKYTDTDGLMSSCNAMNALACSGVPVEPMVLGGAGAGGAAGAGAGAGVGTALCEGVLVGLEGARDRDTEDTDDGDERPQDCSWHREKCMDAYEANGWPRPSHCVLCHTHCQNAAGQWPWLLADTNGRLYCDYNNPLATITGD